MGRLRCLHGPERSGINPRFYCAAHRGKQIDVQPLIDDSKHSKHRNRSSFLQERQEFEHSALYPSPSQPRVYQRWKETSCNKPGIDRNRSGPRSLRVVRFSWSRSQSLSSQLVLCTWTHRLFRKGPDRPIFLSSFVRPATRPECVFYRS